MSARCIASIGQYGGRGATNSNHTFRIGFIVALRDHVGRPVDPNSCELVRERLAPSASTASFYTAPPRVSSELQVSAGRDARQAYTSSSHSATYVDKLREPHVRRYTVLPSKMRIGRHNWMWLCSMLTAVVLLAVFAYAPLPSISDVQRDSTAKHAADVSAGIAGLPKFGSASQETPASTYAFATFLAGDSMHPDNAANLHDDYFVATRLLGYQIMHAPETRSKSAPFIVLATKAVHSDKIERLRRDGAIVIVVETVEKPSWLQGAGASNWQEVFDKLRLWELTQFDLICFFDADTLLNRPLDGIFGDPAVALQYTLNHTDGNGQNEGSLPSTYVFAGQPEMNVVHNYPPSDAAGDYPNIDYLNAGFFVTRPSLELQKFYFDIMQTPERFQSHLPEQNLLNYAHRPQADGGSMPWRALSTEWNMHYPTSHDLKGGVASLHEKWWAPVDRSLSPYMESWRWRMEGFYETMSEHE